MMLIIFKYWQPIAAAIVTAIISLLLHNADIARLEAKQEHTLQEQEAALHAECAKDKEITTEVSHDYQGKLAELNNQLTNIKRLRTPRCVMPVASTTGGRNAGTGQAEYANNYGVDTGTLYDFAKEAEQYRIQIGACQDFIRRTWELKKQ